MLSGKTSGKEKIKVLFVLNTDTRLGGGVEKVVLNYVKYAPRDQFDITVLETDYMDQQRLSDSYVKEIFKDINVVRIKGYDHRFKALEKYRTGLILSSVVLIPALLNILAATSYRKTLKKLKGTDIIYLFKNDYYRLFRKFDSIIIGSNHTSLANERSLATRIEFRLIRRGIVDRRIDGFHFFPSKREILPTLGKKHNLILTNGVDTEIYSPGNREQNKVTKLLFVGRLEPYKGILTLLEAWEQLKDKSGLELHVVGGGSLWRKVAGMVDKTMVYHGILSDEELAQVYRNSDVFVYPTEWDSLPLVVLEALSSGLHVLVSNTMKGTFDDFEERGYLEYMPNDPASVAEKIGKISGEKAKVEEAKDSLHAYVRENYDWKPVTEKLFDFFKTSVESGRK